MKRLFAVLFTTTSLAGCVMAPVDPGPYPMPDGRYPAPYPSTYPAPYPGYGYPGTGTVIIQRGYTPPPVIIQRSPPPVIIQRPPPRPGFEPGHERWRERPPERRPDRGFDRGPSFGPGQGSAMPMVPGVAPRSQFPMAPGGGMPNRAPEARPDNRGPDRGPGREPQRGPDKGHGFGGGHNPPGEMRR